MLKPKYLYHGTHVLFDVIKPLNINMGTRFSKPKLSSYYWKTYEEALGWAMFQTVRRMRKLDIYYHIPNIGPLVREDNYKKAVKLIEGSKGYVYTVDAKGKMVGVGSSPNIHEYTINEPMTPIKIDEVVFTKEMIDQYLTVLSQEDMNKYFEDLDSGKYDKRRGILLSLILVNGRDMRRHDPEVRKKLGLENYPLSLNW